MDDYRDIWVGRQDSRIKRYARYLQRRYSFDSALELRMHLDDIYRNVKLIICKPDASTPAFKYNGTAEEFITDICEAWRKMYGKKAR